jgi:CHAT domain-containing protein/tetratricopeptide (TPR) repeat protein
MSTMPTSEATDFTALIPEMMGACTQAGLPANFAAEAGVFLGNTLAFMRGDGAGLPKETVGAMMCMHALNTLYNQRQWEKVLQFGEPIATGLAARSELSPSVSETLFAARHSALSLLSNAARYAGKFEQALSFAEVACTDAGDDPVAKGTALNHRALALQDLNRLREAESNYREALAVTESLNRDPGHHTARLRELRQTLKGNLGSLLTERDQVHDDVGPVQSDDGVPRGPLSDYPDLFRRPSATQSQRLNSAGLSLMRTGNHEAALESYRQALESLDEIDTELEGIIHCNIAACHNALARPEQALVSYERAIAIHETVQGAWKALATDLYNCGGMLQERGDNEAAAGYFKRAWDVLRTNDEESIVTLSVLRHLAMCRIVQKDYRRARGALERGLTIYERVRPDVAEAEEGHSGALERFRHLLELYLYLAVHESWIEQGAELIERGKARFWYESLFRLGGERAAAGGQSQSGSDLFNHSADRGLYEYNFFVGPNSTFVFAKCDGAAELYRVNMAETELSGLTAQVCLEFQSPGPDDVFSERAVRLSEALFRHTLGNLRRAQEVVVMPDGPLWALPFDALPVLVDEHSRAPLADFAPVVVVPSYAVRKHLSNLPRPNLAKRTCLIVSDPAFGTDMERLEGTRPEGAYVESALGGLHLKDREATAAAFLEHLESADLIHLATHAYGDPEKSEAFLYFSDGSGERTVAVSAAEILQHRLSASLVFLSACSSSIASESVGEGLTSLGRAFLRAGARAVISTQWRVYDDEAAEIIREFYSRLTDGITVASALWRAKNARRKENVSAETWAAFQAYGDGDVAPFGDASSAT